uniref:Uncharacterized protein n=1 Tax=Anolis carolinensis TaxID=28377 RepID=A0A803T466_ANOCA
MTAWCAVTFLPERYLLIYSHWHVFKLLRLAGAGPNNGRSFRSQDLNLGPFGLQMLATFQLCVGFNVLRPLAEKETYLGHLYSFAALHFYLTLSENPTNPTTTLVHILRKGISMKLGVLTIVAQFVGAFVAAVYQNVLWARGILELLSDPHVCSYPLQTNLLKAFGTELVSSFLFQLTLLKSEEQEIRVRANMIAIALTSLVYAGLTWGGARGDRAEHLRHLSGHTGGGARGVGVASSQEPEIGLRIYTCCDSATAL